MELQIPPINIDPVLEAAKQTAQETVTQGCAAIIEKTREDIKRVEYGLAQSIATLNDRINEAQTQEPGQPCPVVEELREFSEYWITPQPRNTQTGSFMNPVSVIGPDMFQKALNRCPPDTTLHLLPGHYSSYGYCQATPGRPKQTVIPKGVKVIGHGPVNITLEPSVEVSHRLIALANSHEDVSHGGSAVENVFIDLNQKANQGCSHEAVLLLGNHSRVRNVEFKDPSNETPDANPLETFVITITDGRNSPAVDCSVEGCSCDSSLFTSKNRQISLIAISGSWKPMIAGKLFKNRLHVKNSPGTQMHNALTIGNGIASRIFDNTVSGPVNAVYLDSYDTIDFFVNDNVFYNARAGVVLCNDNAITSNWTVKPQTWRNIQITHNIIRVAPSQDWTHSCIIVIGGREPHAIANKTESVLIENNTLWLEDNPTQIPIGNIAVNAGFGPYKADIKHWERPIPDFRLITGKNFIHPDLKNFVR